MTFPSRIYYLTLYYTAFLLKRINILLSYFYQYYFLKQFKGSQKNSGKGTEISHIPPVVTHAQPSQLSSSTTKLVTLDEPTLIPHNHPKPIVLPQSSLLYILQVWTSRFNDIPSLWYHVGNFHGPENPLCSIYPTQSPSYYILMANTVSYC